MGYGNAKVSELPPDILSKLMQVGSICCNKCGRAMPRSGVCPACNKSRCHIQLYWKRPIPYKFYRNKQRTLHGYDSATADLIAINRQISEGKFNPAEWISGKLEQRQMRVVLHLWLADKDDQMRKGKLAPGGVAPYHSFVRNYFIPYFGDMDITEAAEKHAVKRFYKELEKKPLKHKTQKNIMDGLHAFFEWCLDSDEDYIQAVPPFPTVSVSDSTPRRSISKPAQQEGINKIPEAHRDLFIMMADMCLRPGEVVAFQVGDYVPELRRIWKRRTESKNRIKENTKQKRKIRKVLPEDSYAIVKKRIEGRFNDKCLEEWLFINPDTGRRYNVKKLATLWNAYSGTGVEMYEAMRHSSLSHIADDTGDPFLVKAAADHADIQTSQKYVHTSEERLRNALNKRTGYTG